jgi:hypothetical protein
MTQDGAGDGEEAFDEVEPGGDRGGKTRTTAARDSRRGILQGLTDLTAVGNLYMGRDRKMLGLEHSLGSRIVTYADDLVILC